MGAFPKPAYLGAAAIVILACGGADATEAHYECSGGTKLTAKFSPPDASTGRVALTFATGQKITLPQVVSADGGRYANDSMEFWTKGRDATLARLGSRETCTTQ